ncbi:MAG TPA: CBS domain-containing protein [Steroidobacteraceae bacterium]|nr:CBS domain-containing protein [Steroidobacteraceae bacterium]
MTRKVSFVDPDMRIPEIARRMRDEDIGSVPVAENEKLIGIVTDRDIVVRTVAEGNDAREATARQVMSPKILYCFEDDSVEDVLRNMGDNQVRRLPVITREKRLVGVVSLGDLSKAAQTKAGSALKDISQSLRH